MEEQLTIDHLSVSYKNKKALSDISLTIEPRKLTGIIGPNGAGKSTLLKSMLGFLPVTKGNVTYLGVPLKEHQRKFAYVEQRQTVDLSFPIDVFGVVLFGTYPKVGLFRQPGKKEKALAWACLEKVGMSEFAKRQIGELSGGQLQRVFIARALAQEADWIFLDEPFVGIDATSEKIIVDLLKQLRDEGKSIVIVHHDLHKVRDYFDRLILLNQTLIATGSVEEVFVAENMKQAYGAEIIDMMNLGGNNHDS